MKVLITGASGFIGSFIVEESLKRGFETWAAIRHGSSKKWLTDERIHFLQLDFEDESGMIDVFRNLHFDFVVHAAGATKGRNASDFQRANTDATRHLVNALIKAEVPLKRFIFISSLSVMGNIREEFPYRAMTESDTPRPNTAYAQSKWAAEQWLETIKDRFPYIVLRPTGVYGPREHDYFMLCKSISNHIDFSAGWKPQKLTFIYVDDVVQAVFLAMQHGKNGEKYILSDGAEYSDRDFSDLVRAELGQPFVCRIKAPLFVLRIITVLGDIWGRLSGQITALNKDKYHILKQRNWLCDISKARNELNFHPEVLLKDGVKRTVAWYKENHWL